MEGGLLAWLHASAIGVAMRASAWSYPAAEIVHIAGFVMLVGAVAMFDLRVLGAGRYLPVRALARFLLPWSCGALLLVVPAGLAMFAAHPQEMAANPLFRLKLVLLVLAGCNAALFHLGVYRTVDAWPLRAPALARLHAMLSIVLWMAVIGCGRLLAYV